MICRDPSLLKKIKRDILKEDYKPEIIINRYSVNSIIYREKRAIVSTFQLKQLKVQKTVNKFHFNHTYHERMTPTKKLIWMFNHVEHNSKTIWQKHMSRTFEVYT